MRMPPAFISLRVRHDGFRIPRLWIPIFLLWPFVALLLVPLLPMVYAFYLFMSEEPGKRFAEFCRTLYQLVCETQGTSVDFENSRTQVGVRID